MELGPTVKHTKFTEKWHGKQYLHFCDGKKNTGYIVEMSIHIMKIKSRNFIKYFCDHWHQLTQWPSG
jgi:hypothetical protein